MDVDAMDVDEQEGGDAEDATGVAGHRHHQPDTQAETEALLQPTQQEELGGVAVEASRLPWTIATLKTGVEFLQLLESHLGVLRDALTTSSPDVTKELIALAAYLSELHVAGSAQLLRATWACILNREEAVRGTVVDAVYNLHLKDMRADGERGARGPAQHAHGLVALMPLIKLGEAAALEELLRVLCSPGASGDASLDPELHPKVVKALMWYCEQVLQAAKAAKAAGTPGDEACQQAIHELRAGLLVLAMVAPYRAAVIRPKLRCVWEWAHDCMCTLEDAWCVRQCCLIVKAVAPVMHDTEGQAAAEELQDTCTRMLRVLRGLEKPASEAAPGQTQEVQPKLGSQWYMAAEAAVAAIYALHPQPQELLQPFLLALVRHTLQVDPAAPEQVQVPYAQLSRTMFLVAHCALHQLALVDQLAKRIRNERVLSERLACERAEPSSSGARQRAATRQPAAADGADDSLAQVGGSAAVGLDAALDGLKESVEAELLAPGSFLHTLATLVSYLCQTLQYGSLQDGSSQLLQEDVQLRDCLLLCLVKLMLVDRAFCERHMELLFNCLDNHAMCAGATSTLMLGVADLARRFPNTVEPYTARMYQPLRSEDPVVRKTTLTVLSHLILNDMMKVKGHIAGVALLLRDQEPSIRTWAHTFFTTLAHRTSGAKGGTNPIYNLMPDILSALAAETQLGHEETMQILRVLLTYVKDTKQADAFREKLCQRFGTLHETEAARAAAEAVEAAASEAQQPAGDMGADISSRATQGVEKVASPSHSQAAAPATAAEQAQQVAHSSGLPAVIKAEAVASQQATGVVDAPPAEEAEDDAMDVDMMDVCEDAAQQPSTTAGTQQEAGRPAGAPAATTVEGAAEEVSAGGAQQSAGQGAAGAAQQGEGGVAAAAQQQQRQARVGVVREWRLLAACLKELGYTEKGAAKLMDKETLKHYVHTLGDKEVFNFFWSMAGHARQTKATKADPKAEIRDLAARYMEEIAEVHKALCEGQASDDVVWGEEEEGQDMTATAAGEEQQRSTAEAAGGEQDADATVSERCSSLGSVTGRGRAAAGRTTSTRSQAAAGGPRSSSSSKQVGRPAASKTGSRRRKAAESEEEEEELEEEEGDSSDTEQEAEVAGPRRAGATAGRQQAAAAQPAPARRTTAEAAKAKPSKAAPASSSSRRKKVVSSSDDSTGDDESSGDDVAADPDQDDSSDGASGSSLRKKVQQLKVSSAASTGGKKGTSGRGGRAAGLRAVKEEPED